MTEYFDILLDAAKAAGGGDVERCYHLLNIVLHRSVDQKLAGSNIHFGGLFAKTDFLCKEYGVDSSVVKNLNALRHFLRHPSFRDVDWHSDVQCLALFISKVYDEPVPQALQLCWLCLQCKELREVFPLKHDNKVARKIKSDCIHMVVESWTENTITGNTDELGRITATIPEGSEYITQLLSEGTLVNLVKLNADNVPELIIYQPDYLVDISTIANCFESYADTPYCALINRLRTVPPTKAIHLGNLASQFLDEEVHGGDMDYASSVTDFFHHHALDMAAATDIDSGFHKEAMAQKENIRIAVHETLEKEVGHFDAKQSLLEPSFFCEMLGLQGRMDLLQRDYRVLIEQKSGKGGFPQQDPEVPVYLEKHYVQMLLYMALLHYGYKRDGKAIKNSDIQSFLLYSKYKKGLVRLGPAPELLHRALMLRNQIAFCDISYANGGTDNSSGLSLSNVLTQLTPESLRRKKMSDKFWQTWIRPELAKVLDPIMQASPLEKAYFFRMLQFVAKEHLLSKMGNNNKESSGFASKWHDSLEDKLLAGDIFCGMTIKERGTEHLTLETELDDSAVSANFRKGDIVVLYPYQRGTEPDVRKTMVHRCSIVDISMADDKLTLKLKLKSPQTDVTIFDVPKGFVWAIEHDFYESSSTGLYRSLHQFLTAPADRKALILGQRPPEYDASAQLVGDYGQFNDLVLKAKQAKDLFLVIGPPGTGKTSFGLMNILKEHLANSTSKNSHFGGGGVLLMAYTNRAVDEICSKLVEANLDFFRIGNPLSAEAVYHKYLLENRSKECKNIGEIKSLIANTRIFVGTTTAITGASVSLFALKTFDLAIIDEASQILEPQLLGLLSATTTIKDSPLGGASIRKFVLIGDHKQLPAVVQQSPEDSKVTDPLLLDIGLTDCRNSFFERMLNMISNRNPDQGVRPLDSGFDSKSCYLLRKQGRMHPEIADYPNQTFYESQLGIAGLPHQLEEMGMPRLRFISVPKPEHAVSDKVNEAEARVIAQEVMKVCEEYGDSFDPLTTVGVIVPYRNQIAAIRNEISKLAIERNYSLPFGGGQGWGAIDTVERYQGSQRDVIIYGFTVQYRYQLKFMTSATFSDPISGALIDRRLNVALTRARKREIIVGNPEILKHSEVFRGLLTYCGVTYNR